MKVILFTVLLFALSDVIAQDTMHVEGSEFVFIDKKVNKTSRLEFTPKDFKRLAASFDDPTRILMHYPGFSAVNDQANGLSYHGLSSHLFDWQLNGVEIVNPNHLSNAGTFSDLASPSSGGVSMFSGNVIDNYQFKSNLDSERQGISLGGTSNINVDGLKQSYVQASLLGIEAGLKLTENENRHLSINGRYSFTGLLDNLGVKFGNESIKFQDVMVRAKLFSNQKNKISGIFFLGGSSNYHQMVDSNFTVVKDYLNIDYKSNIKIGQFSHQYDFAEGSSLNSTVSFSIKNDERSVKGKYNAYQFNDWYSNKEHVHAFHQFLTIKSVFKLGYKTIYSYKKLFNARATSISESINNDDFEVLAYMNYDIPIYSNLNVNINLLSGMKKNKLFYPSMKLSYKIRSFSSHLFVSRSYQNIVKYFSDNTTNSDNVLLEISFTRKSSKSSVKFFYHNIKNIPGGFNYMNLLNTLPVFEPINKFDAGSKIQGVELEQQFDLNNFWCNVNATFFNANFSNTVVPTSSNLENNFKYIYNVNLGKKFKIGKNQLAASLSYHQRGGQYNYFIYTDPYYVSPNYSLPLNDRLSPYKRLDLRINYTYKKSFWSLDIQNILNKENDAFKSYDIDRGILVNKQLGLIPVLTYKRWL